MALSDLFGFPLGRRRRDNGELSSGGDSRLKSVVAPNAGDGTASVEIAPSGFYASTLDLDGQIRDENAQIAQYRTMINHGEIESAVDDIINEAIVTEEGTPTVRLVLDDVDMPDKVKDAIRNEFDKILRMLDFNNRGYEIFRKWYVDGRIYFHMIVDPTQQVKGIQELRFVDPINIRKVQEIKKEKQPGTNIDLIGDVVEYFLFTPETKPGMGTGQAVKISPESISYINSGLFDPQKKLIISYLHKAIKPLNQLRMIEDAVVIYRISRAPERRIFYIDIGSLPKMKAEEYMRSLMNKYRNKLVYDAATGELRDEKRHMSMLEDYWLPRREGGKGTEIQTLPGGQNLSEMQDVEYFKKKLYRSLNVPISRLESSNGFNLGRSSEITRDELKFSKFVSKLRSKFNGLFLQILRRQLTLKKIIRPEEWPDIEFKIHLDYLRDSHFTELKNAEIMKSRLELLNGVDNYVGRYFSTAWVRKNILMQPEELVAELDGQVTNEKKEGIIGGERDTAQIKTRIDALETIDKYIGKYYSLGYIRRNILQQNPSEIAAMDKEIEAEKALGIKPEPSPDLIRALGGAKAYGMGYDQSPSDVTKDVDSGLDSIGSEKDPSMSADPNDPNAPQETQTSATNGEPKVAGGGETTAVQDTALNGAQVESLLTIVTNVKMGLLPKEAGKALVDAAFPSLTREQINSIFDPIEPDKAPPPMVPQAPSIPGAKPAAPKAPKKPKV
jgi:hypothetical protein